MAESQIASNSPAKDSCPRTSGPRRQSVLFALHYAEPARTTVAPLCDALEAGGSYDCQILVEQDRDNQLTQFCERRRLPCTVLEDVPQPNGSSPSGVELSGQTVARRLLARILRHTNSSFRHFHETLNRMGAVLDRIQPSVVVLLDDRTIFTAQLIRAAELRGVPSVVVQWAATHRARAMAEIRADSGTLTRHGLGHALLGRLVSRLVPSSVMQVKGRQVWFVPPAMTLAMWLCDAFPRRTPWTVGGGNATLVAAAGDVWRQRLIDSGADSAKIVVTGLPANDRWCALRQAWSAADARAVYRDLDLEPDRKVITIISPALAFRQAGAARAGDVSIDQMHDYLRFVVHEALSLDAGFSVVFKAHPRDGLGDFSFLREHLGDQVRLVHDYSIERLVAASDLVVCQWSSTVMIAQAFDVPCLVFDFHACASSDMWRDAPGLAFAENRRGFVEQLTGMASDPNVNKQLADGREQFRRGYLRLDGKATERIVGHIQAVANRSCN